MDRDRPHDRTSTETRELFRSLGVDIDSQEQLNEFRADLVYARRLRRLSERSAMMALRALITALVGGALVALWQGIRFKIGGAP